MSPKSGSALHKIHWSLWVDTKKIVTICSSSITSESVGGSAPQQEQQESGSIEVGVSLFVNKDRVPRVFPQRKFARKPCTSTCERPPISSLMFGRDFTPTDVGSKHRRPKSCGHCPQNLGNRTFGKPFWPEPVVAQGQGRVASRGCVPQDFALKAMKTKAKSAHCRAVLHRARSSISRAFIATR
jgi:hypothetical protein